MSELAANKIKRVLAMYYTDGSCNAECARAICDCGGMQADYAMRAAQAVLTELRAPLAAILDRYDFDGEDVADEVLARLGKKV